MVEDARLYRYFTQLHEQLIQGQSSELASESHLLYFLHLLLQRHPEQAVKSSPLQGLSPLQLNVIKQRIYDEPWQNTQLSTFATEVHLSKFQFLRQFKQATGMTPHAYLKRVRLELAKKSLSRGAASGRCGAAVGIFRSEPS